MIGESGEVRGRMGDREEIRKMEGEERKRKERRREGDGEGRRKRRKREGR